MPTAKWTQFPSEVTLDPILTARLSVPEFRECMVQVTTDGQVYVWGWDAEHNMPALLVSGALVTVPQLPNQLAPRYASQWQANLVDGGGFTVQRGSGCGCRNPLKGTNPVQSMFAQEV